MQLEHGRVIGAVLLAMVSTQAQAQSGFAQEAATKVARRAGVHLNLSVREPVDPDVTKGTSLGLSFGLSPGRTTGWTYPVGLNIFSEELHSPNGEPFAVMRSRSITAGIGYRWVFGRLITGPSLQTGFAFNSGRIEGDIPRAFGVPNEAISVHVGNAALFRPQVEAEYMIRPKFSIRISADYVLMRPAIDVTTPFERIAGRWSASNVHASIGIGYYPLRK